MQINLIQLFSLEDVRYIHPKQTLQQTDRAVKIYVRYLDVLDGRSTFNEHVKYEQSPQDYTYTFFPDI